VFEGFLEGISVGVKFAADGAFALPIDEDATADLGPGLHVGVHPKTSRWKDQDGLSEPPILVQRP